MVILEQTHSSFAHVHQKPLPMQYTILGRSPPSLHLYWSHLQCILSNLWYLCTTNHLPTMYFSFFFPSVFQAIYLGLTTVGEISVCVTIFQSNHWGSHIPTSWMVQAGCAFVAGIHPSRTWTLQSFESVQWHACVHWLDLGLYSHQKEVLGNAVRTHTNSKGKIPSTGSSKDWTHDPTSHRTTSPIHYGLSYLPPPTPPPPPQCIYRSEVLSPRSTFVLQ